MNGETTIQDKGIKRISSLMDAWWKVALIIGSIIAVVVSSVKSWMDIQASIKQGNINKEEIQFLKERSATKDDVKAVGDNVTRQWSVQTEINNRQDKDIREVKEKQVFEDGRRAGSIKQ